MNKATIDHRITSCDECSLSLLEVNDNDRCDVGYGKLISLDATAPAKKVMIVGLNPSRVRFTGLIHPFSAGDDDVKQNVGSVFIHLLKQLGVFEYCYVTNLVKCSTANNDVDDNVIRTCASEHFREEVNYCRPLVIIACGTQVYKHLFKLRLDVPLEKIQHPNYCFTYHGISIDDYIDRIREVFSKHGFC